MSKELFETLERKLNANQQQAAKVIGVAKSTYSEYRSGTRQTPLYIRYAVDTLMLLSDTDLQAVTAKRLSKRS